MICASSAQEALGILRVKKLDVVISDEEMPGLSGTAFLKEVRRLYPDTIRFILTGKATLDTAIQAINEGGISGFFLKPCNDAELVLSIRRELEKRDLIVAAARLLQKVKRQTTLIARLEIEHPNITKVHRDRDGAVLLEAVPGDLTELTNEIYRELDKTPTDTLNSEAVKKSG